MNPYRGHHRRLGAPTGNPAQKFRALAEHSQHAIRQTQASEDDDSEYAAAQQLKDIRVLLSHAEPETEIVPFSGPIAQLHSTGSPEGVDRQLPPESAKQVEKTGRGAATWRFVRTDQMLRNALFLIVNSGVSAGLGFAFWIITARLFSTESVGLASSLTSASNLIMYLGLLGMNTTFVRYLPMAKNRDRLITAGVSLVAAGSGALALVCVVLLPLISRPLAFVTHSLPLAVGFVLLTAGAGVNLLADSAFIAASKSQYNILIDGVIGGGTKIILLFALAGAGAYGVFGASDGGFVASAVASLFLMIKVLHWRPEFKSLRQALKPVLSFSGTSYAGSVLALLPILVVPLIILGRIGASSEAYYYVSYQLATMIYQAVYAVEQSFLSEGAGAEVLSAAVLKRSIRMLAALCIPAFTLVILFEHQLLVAFGSKYADHSGSALILLGVAVFPIAASNWCMTVLRLLTNKLRSIVWASAVSDAVIIGLAWVWAPRGVEAVAMAWPVGCTAGLLVVVVPTVKALRRSRSTRQHHPT
jgi:O-antigen/teichoic acid export membrane protein